MIFMDTLPLNNMPLVILYVLYVVDSAFVG